MRTAFSMPDVLSVGLGGGSIIRFDAEGKVNAGPNSVGHYLTSKAVVFGGDVMTSTDIVVASGKEAIGNAKGYAVGKCFLPPLSDKELSVGENSEKRHLVIPFQNKFLYAAYMGKAELEETEVICTAPVLLSLLGEDGGAIGS